MTTFDVAAVYRNSRLEMTIPPHDGFFIDLFKTVPLRCITFQNGFSLENPKVEIVIRGGHHQDAEKVFARHFPYAGIFGKGV